MSAATATATDARLQRLADGFNSLLDEYNHLLTKSQVLENSVKDAKTQFSTFIVEKGPISKEDLCDFEIVPPPKDIETTPRTQAPREKWWMRSNLPVQKGNLLRIRYAVDATHSLGLDKRGDEMCSKMSSEVADPGTPSAMPSIVESPLEQDFTTAGTPSRLGCPFASMTNRRLSAHAASVVSRYRPTGIMTPRSSTSRINGRGETPRSPQPLTNGTETPTEVDEALTKKSTNEIEASIQGSGPQCPIRFLDKNSPEEVAEYFEKHKHELPRSHEVCVKRYQSNSESIRQLDAKYGNLVSMIQGLGQKHVPMLPEQQDDGNDTDQDDARVMKWASDVSNVAQAATDTPEHEDRQPRFDRDSTLKDVRVGESPSRPWGIQVPLNVLEQAQKEEKAREQGPTDGEKATKDVVNKPSGGCPIAKGASPGMINPHTEREGLDKGEEARGLPGQRATRTATAQKDMEHTGAHKAQPVFLPSAGAGSALGTSSMTFTGPVFIGYSAEQAAAVIKALQSRE